MTNLRGSEADGIQWMMLHEAGDARADLCDRRTIECLCQCIEETGWLDLGVGGELNFV